MPIIKHPIRFGGGEEPIVTGMEYQIPFGGVYIKYDDGDKVFKFFSKDNTIIYSAQLVRGMWFCKIIVYTNQSRFGISFQGFDKNRKSAWKKVREELSEYKKAISLLTNLKK